MGLFFSTAQNGGFQSENVLWEPQPQVLLNEKASKLSLLDEKYITQPNSPLTPTPPRLDQSILATNDQKPPEEKYFDPLLVPERCKLP